MMGIYVHIPFCEKKCIYCAFASFVAQQDEKDKYFSRLCQEIESSQEGGLVGSVYFGGGTPSSVSESQIEQVMNALKRKFRFAKNAEITIECNPCSASAKKLSAYKRMGFNRISFGVQSLDNACLKFLGRLHDRSGALEAIKRAKECGFDNISADLILGADGRDLCKDAQELIASGVKHISAYMLQIEDGTPLKKIVENKQVNLPSDDEVVDNYQKLADFLQKNGLKRYEISNFAQKGYESKHNKGYWLGSKYLGFGLGAHSFDGKNVRSANASEMQAYLNGQKWSETLSPQERDEEIIMLGLRCKFGFKIKDLSFDITSQKQFREFVRQKILRVSGAKVKLNPAYYGVSNLIITKLLQNA